MHFGDCDRTGPMRFLKGDTGNGKPRRPAPPTSVKPRQLPPRAPWWQLTARALGSWFKPAAGRR